MTQQQFTLDGISSSEAKRYEDVEPYLNVPCKILDIPESIPTLGYASHQFFRYYGKFPSLVGREIVSRFHLPGASVLDCYAGSGTTLVEAQIKGLVSYGVDINPLATLASNVKTAYYDMPALNSAFAQVLKDARASDEAIWMPRSVSDSKLSKWFTPKSIQQLSRLRGALNKLEPSREKLFLLTCFLAIVRRTSNAFDGEVRPHVNKEKRPRPPLAAFQDKFAEMMTGLRELDSMRSEAVPSKSVIGDNRNTSAYDNLLSGDSPGLVVAHPPYLNSFNYLQVFSLEFMWGEECPELWQGWTAPEIRSLEHIAWPATDSDLVRRYYADFYSTTKAATANLMPGGVFAVVVGDATIHGRLEPVHQHIWTGLKEIGLIPIEVWLRTTHYGIGKYAYSHRADYHGEAEKKDAILFLRKPG